MKGLINHVLQRRHLLTRGAACFVLLCAFGATATMRAQTNVNDEAPISATEAVRRLTNRDALVRQRAAEELAHLAAIEQRKLVEGYRLQEKNARVRLALDWALYRMGKADALYAVVQALDSTRYNQAQAYLAELETPQPLYPLLERVNGNTQIKLLEALARTGDAATLEVVKPYADSPDAGIADAARFAQREINLRLAQPTSPDARTRARKADDAPAKP